ncbi:peptide deformylase [Amylibacter marinus]|uniref:Peptide deformylase n=1 Tax=Amylibacter marinus TaxID=1475483 RepID=A0ABQ5VV97_9RHOB|nr:peptide deformylase [Amylibacter marinus]GLQ35059.1 peptide deformylase [Amylibacter marinus]
MSILPIILHPDPRLKKTCDPVETVSKELRQLADSMLETMYDAPGVGLAAPQIGTLNRLFVMDCGDKEVRDEPTVLINPEITWVSEELNTHNEGCLSLPDLFEDIERPKEVRIKFLDIDGTPREEQYDGLWATCAQHELDHLNGVLFIDHLSRIKRSMMTKKMVKYKKEVARG